MSKLDRGEPKRMMSSPPESPHGSTPGGSARSAGRASWRDDTIACLLRLRYIEMIDHFRACKTVFETAEAWTVLSNKLNQRMDRSFTSHQCQSKVRLPGMNTPYRVRRR